MNNILLEKIKKYEEKIYGSGKKNYKVISNNGTDNGMTNQCLWISIQKYLLYVLKKNLTISEIKNIASNNNEYSINGKYEEFDTDKHTLSLINLAKKFRLTIYFYTQDKNDMSISDSPISFYGVDASENIVHIVHYGSHFELIISFNGIDFFEGFTKQQSSNFIPNIKLGLGIDKPLEDEKSDILDKYITHNDLISVQILSIENRLYNIKKNIDKLIKDYNDSTDKERESEMLKVLIYSYMESKVILESEQTFFEQELEKLKKKKKELENSISKIVNKSFDPQ